MKLKKLNKALVAAGLVAGATISMPSQAVVMSDDGTGEVLLFPFYTVQGPQVAPRTTLFTIKNTTGEYKAVKVRFHEAHNSRDALDFNLYLSPFDVWTGAVSRDGSGVAQLTTTDLSCTIPTSIMNTAHKFSTLAYTQDSNNDGGNQHELRTNEGYVEVLEMGEVQNGHLFTDGSDYADTTIDDFHEAIEHEDGIPGGYIDEATGLPIGCLALEASSGDDGTWEAPVNDPQQDSPEDLDNTHISVTEPTGGLSGSGMIVQATIGTVAAYNATALKHFYDVAPYCGGEMPADVEMDALMMKGYYDCASGDEFNTPSPTATGRAFDDLHSFKDLDPTTANARSVQTYPNLAMAYPQMSTIFDAEYLMATHSYWANNEVVSSGITRSKDNELFAAVRDLQEDLENSGGDLLSDSTAEDNCGGLNGVQSESEAGAICGNARPVSAVLASAALMNEYVLEQDANAGVDFRTDVVVTFPTKWYFSDNGLFDDGEVVDSSGDTVPDLQELALAPFTKQFVSPAGSGQRDRACEPFSINQEVELTDDVTGGIWDREETEPTPEQGGGLVPSPAINPDRPDGIDFCQEANVLTLNDGDLLSSRIANGLSATVENSQDGTNSFNIDVPFSSGWFAIAFDIYGGHSMTAVESYSHYHGEYQGYVNGLPALGFVVEGLVETENNDNFTGFFTAALPHQKIVDVD